MSQNFHKNGNGAVVPLTVRSSPMWSTSKDSGQWEPPKIAIRIFQHDSGRHYEVWMSTDEARSLAAEIAANANEADAKGKRPEPMF